MLAEYCAGLRHCTSPGSNLNGKSAVPSGLSGVVQVATGDFHSCAAKEDGTVTCWGAFCPIPFNVHLFWFVLTVSWLSSVGIAQAGAKEMPSSGRNPQGALWRRSNCSWLLAHLCCQAQRNCHLLGCGPAVHAAFGWHALMQCCSMRVCTMLLRDCRPAQIWPARSPQRTVWRYSCCSWYGPQLRRQGRRNRYLLGCVYIAAHIVVALHALQSCCTAVKLGG